MTAQQLTEKAAFEVAREQYERVVPTLRFDERVWAFNPDPPLLRKLLNGQVKQQA